MSPPVDHTVMTWKEWRERLEAASVVADKLIALTMNDHGASPPLTRGPGEAVLALMLAARAICVGYPQLPPFEWYFRRVAELVGLRGDTPPARRDPPS
jgi:hypothetical protein